MDRELLREVLFTSLFFATSMQLIYRRKGAKSLLGFIKENAGGWFHWFVMHASVRTLLDPVFKWILNKGMS